MSQTVLPSLRHPLLAAMDAVGSGLTAAVDADCWPLSDAEVGQLLDEIDVAEARLAAVKLTAVAEADRRGPGRADGAPSTAGWLRQRHLTHPGAAASTVALAGALDRHCQGTAAALAGGRLSAGHAQVIVATLAALPPV